jgi:hypothetical protein
VRVPAVESIIELKFEKKFEDLTIIEFFNLLRDEEKFK